MRWTEGKVEAGGLDSTIDSETMIGVSDIESEKVERGGLGSDVEVDGLGFDSASGGLIVEARSVADLVLVFSVNKTVFPGGFLI